MLLLGLVDPNPSCLFLLNCQMAGECPTGPYHIPDWNREVLFCHIETWTEYKMDYKDVCISCIQADTRGAQGISHFFQSEQYTACMYTLQYRAFIPLFVHFLAWEMLLSIPSMLISLWKKFVCSLMEIMWMYDVRVETVQTDCWLLAMLLSSHALYSYSFT